MSILESKKRSYNQGGYNKATRVVGGRVLSYRPSAPVYGSSRWISQMKGLNRRGVASKETGFVDLTFNTYQMDTTGTITLIATVAQGASVNQRIGKKWNWKSIQFRGNVSNNATALTNDCGFLLVYDRQPTGALPAITDILVSVSPYAMNNDANSERFRILKRSDFALIGNTGTPVLTDCTMASADFYLDLKNLPAQAKAAGTGAIGDLQLGALYLVTYGNTVTGTAAAVMQGTFRTRFVDDV